MAIVPKVLVFSPPNSFAVSGQKTQFVARLEAQGFVVIVCEQVRQLYQVVQQTAVHQGPGHAQTPLFIILKGTPVDNQAAAAYLRTLHSCLGIIAALTTPDEVEIIETLQSGVDAYYFHGASCQLKVATLLALQRCCNAGVADLIAGHPPQAGKWRLLEQAWVLDSPEGKSISLTTGERAFFLTLLKAPDRYAAHAELLAAIDACSSPRRDVRVDSRRLGVLLSRLRRKCASQALKLPVQSVHSAGYMFAGDLE